MATTMTGKELYEYLTSSGMSSAGATGIVANLQAESGLNSEAAQPNGPGRGIAQWSVGGRWDQLVAWAKGAKRDPKDINTQLFYVQKEMKASGLWDRLKKTTDERAATRMVLKEYERPKDQSEAEVTRRLNLGKSTLGGAEDLNPKSIADTLKGAFPDWLTPTLTFASDAGKIVGVSLLGVLLIILGLVAVIASTRTSKNVAAKVSPVS